MNITMLFLSLFGTILLLNRMHKMASPSDDLVTKDNSSPMEEFAHDLVSAKPSTAIEIPTKHIKVHYLAVINEDMLNQIEKRILISADFIHWLNSFRKKYVFITKFKQHKNLVVAELIAFFSSDTPHMLALMLPNNKDSVIIKLLVDNNGIQSITMHSSSPTCPAWACALVDAAAASAGAAKKALGYTTAESQEMQKLFQKTQTRQTEEMYKLFKKAYDELSDENKHEYFIWGKEHNIEAGNLASYIFLAHWACIYDDTACLQTLKDLGAGLDIPDNNGSTPAHYAVENCYTDCLEILKNGGANFNILDNDGCTPAYYAAEDNCIECLTILNRGNANFNIPNKDGRTPAHGAAIFGSEACLQTLKSFGADFSAQNNNGDTPAHLAARYNPNKLKLLHDFGADINLQNKAGQTPAHCATNGNNTKCLQLLKTIGANFNCQDNDGNTPAHYANQPYQYDAERLYAKNLETLIANGANINIQNKEGDTPAHLAAKHRYATCLKILKDHDACFDIKNIQNQTARAIALNRGIRIDTL